MSKIKVKFNKTYIASRGPAIAGMEGETREYRMTDALKALIDDGVCELVKQPKAATRKKATRKPAEKT